MAKPILRGYSHALAAPAALLATILLLRNSSGRPDLQVAFSIYGATLVLLFAGSATYHIGRWPAMVEGSSSAWTTATSSWSLRVPTPQ